MGASVNPADLIIRNLRALHGALEHSVTIQATRLQELMDDLVARGALTRAEADHLVGQLVTTSRAYSQALLQVLDSVTTESRKVLAAPKVLTSPVRATAGLLVETVRQAPKLVVPGRRTPAPAPAPAAPAPAAAAAPDLPDVPDLADLTVAQAKPRLAGLDAAGLRRARAQEAAGKNRKGVLAEIDRLLARDPGA
ncbi:hypothetical protein GUY44_04495 [Pimelobacter simplex]|uniref:Uncharacterized protein n=1 Tax=Nocardioides simplex TaxID=2045 RepID=A0A0A1DJ33_NOCSI|nr:hypothetical protein [Pimelobacter simplex]AIY17396.1 hypothetical protein KR76_12680 [Pimelobacter simplex]MCG8149728.1 hypothetical protein [Pimelobacter simplex]GEB14057.1 hypothetical protein NSI01_23720 [Pimelobacter simplex]SFM64532.1 hypothetical protein SAMN05421671_2614 [Pimelobacter simplex]